MQTACPRSSSASGLNAVRNGMYEQLQLMKLARKNVHMCPSTPMWKTNKNGRGALSKSVNS
eukprot:1408335-Amphidinium_carterae.1